MRVRTKKTEYSPFLVVHMREDKRREKKTVVSIVVFLVVDGVVAIVKFMLVEAE